MAMVVAVGSRTTTRSTWLARSAQFRAGSFTPLFCGGLHGYEDDDDIGGGGQQALFVRTSSPGGHRSVGALVRWGACLRPQPDWSSLSAAAGPAVRREPHPVSVVLAR